MISSCVYDMSMIATKCTICCPQCNMATALIRHEGLQRNVELLQIDVDGDGVYAWVFCWVWKMRQSSGSDLVSDSDLGPGVGSGSGCLGTGFRSRFLGTDPEVGFPQTIFAFCSRVRGSGEAVGPRRESTISCHRHCVCFIRTL